MKLILGVANRHHHTASMVTPLLAAIGIHRRCMTSGLANRGWRMVRESRQNQKHTKAAPECISFHGQWPADEQKKFCHDMLVVPQFLDETEESGLLSEVEPYLKRLRYEFDHWDDAIHGYRETERKHWQPSNRAIIDRIVGVAFDGVAMPYVHVLDLAGTGVIKPHVDSVRYCGNIIAGISLLSDAVMRLVRTNDEEQTNDEYRQIFAKQRHMKYWADVLLPRRSLYVMRDTARYKFTHEILAPNESQFLQRPVSRSRRISIICRNEPT